MTPSRLPNTLSISQGKIRCSSCRNTDQSLQMESWGLQRPWCIGLLLLYLGRIFIDDPDQILASLQERFGGWISFKVRLEMHHKSNFVQYVNTCCLKTNPGQKIMSVQTHQQETGLLQRWSRHVCLFSCFMSVQSSESCLDTNNRQQGVL